MAKKISIICALVVWCSYMMPISVGYTESRVQLFIEQGSTQLKLNVELAGTAEARSVGLMHRRDLPELGGMLFDFEEQKPVAMWMKNTLIPLDMIFANDQGVVHFIKQNYFQD